MFSIRIIQLFLFILCTLGVGLLLVAICIEIDVINVVVFNWYKITKARGSKYMTDHRNKYDKYNRYLVTLVVLMCFVLVEFLSPLGQVSASKGKFYVKDGVLTKYWGQESKVVIPNGIKEIGYGAFEANFDLKEVTIPKSVKKISKYAFMACSSLNKVNWGEGIEVIEFHAFRNCTKLKNISIPKSVKYIGGRAFEGTPWMAKKKGFVIVNNILLQYNGKKKSITVPNGVEKISGYAFYDKFSEDKSWHGPTSVVLPESVYGLDESTFASCTRMKSIEILGEVAEIPYDCFYYCTSLKEIQLPNTITTISDGAFFNTENLTEFEFPTNLKVIGEMAFFQSNFEKIDLPQSLIKIGDSAFYDSYYLEEIKIPKSVKLIGPSAFRNCQNLKNVVFGSEKTIIDSAAFDRTPWYDNMKGEFIIINNCLMAYNGKATKVVIPKEVKYVNQCYYKTSVKEIILPKGLKGIGYRGLSGLAVKKIYIPNSVESIGDYAFAFMDNLKKIELPDNISKIGKGVFRSCDKLSYIKMPANIEKFNEEVFEEMNKATIQISSKAKKIIATTRIDSLVPYSELTIACKKDTPAYKYAKKNGCKIKLQ